MPTMASSLVRAARDASAASRAARSAAFAATCAARSAAARSAAARAAAGAATEDPSHAHWSGIGHDARRAAFRDTGVSFAGDEPQKPVSACFSAEEKDLESDEALWALYERWCKHYNQERDPEEMAQRFHKFKKTALHVHQVNKANLSYKLGLNQFSDGKLAELCLPEQGVLARYELETRSWS